MEISTSTNICAFGPGRTRYPVENSIRDCADAGYRVLDINFCMAMNPDSPLRGEGWEGYVRSVGRLAESFLSTGGDEPCLKTFYIAAAAAVILFAVLAVRFCRKEKEGSTAIAFLLLFGASAIITESLRYDRFLSISFVGLQQVAAALTLAVGMILAVRRNNRPKSGIAVAAIISLPLMVGLVIGLEFALDRTTWNKILIYIAMIITVGIPALLGLKLLKQQ